MFCVPCDHAIGEVSGLARGAYHGDHVGGGHASGQQLLNRETAQVARGSGDGIR